MESCFKKYVVVVLKHVVFWLRNKKGAAVSFVGVFFLRNLWRILAWCYSFSCLSTRSGLIKSDMQLEKCTGWRDVTNSSGHNHVERITAVIDQANKVSYTLAHPSYPAASQQ